MRVSKATNGRRPPLVSKLYGLPEPRKPQNAPLLRDIDLTAVALAIDHELNRRAFEASRGIFQQTSQASQNDQGYQDDCLLRRKSLGGTNRTPRPQLARLAADPRIQHIPLSEGQFPYSQTICRHVRMRSDKSDSCDLISRRKSRHRVLLRLTPFAAKVIQPSSS